MKVYAVYSIPKSPEYHLLGLYKTKDLAKEAISKLKIADSNLQENNIYDLQLEEIIE